MVDLTVVPVLRHQPMKTGLMRLFGSPSNRPIWLSSRAKIFFNSDGPPFWSEYLTSTKSFWYQVALHKISSSSRRFHKFLETEIHSDRRPKERILSPTEDLMWYRRSNPCQYATPNSSILSVCVTCLWKYECARDYCVVTALGTRVYGMFRGLLRVKNIQFLSVCVYVSCVFVRVWSLWFVKMVCVSVCVCVSRVRS